MNRFVFGGLLAGLIAAAACGSTRLAGIAQQAVTADCDPDTQVIIIQGPINSPGGSGVTSFAEDEPRGVAARDALEKVHGSGGARDIETRVAP